MSALRPAAEEAREWLDKQGGAGGETAFSLALLIVRARVEGARVALDAVKARCSEMRVTQENANVMRGVRLCDYAIRALDPEALVREAGGES